MPRQDSTSEVPDLLLMGRVGKPHGVRGEVKVVPETDDPERFLGLETVFLGISPEAAQPHDVGSVRFQQTKRGPVVLLHLAGVDGKDEAAALRGRDVYAREADLPPLEDDEFYLHDLLDLTVVTDDGETIGTVVDIMELPTYEVLVVARPGQSDALIPAVSEFIEDIDLDAERLVVRPIEGLLE